MGHHTKKSKKKNADGGWIHHQLLIPTQLYSKYFTIPKPWRPPKGTTMNLCIAEVGRSKDPQLREDVIKLLKRVGATVGLQDIIHKYCGWHNVEFISLALWSWDRQNNLDSVSKVLQRVQAH